MASKTLEALQHHQDPLLELFLTPRMSNLMFTEVVNCILQENRHASECFLSYLQGPRLMERLTSLTSPHKRG